MSDSKGQLKKLRFAPLVRVSTEGQATKGESLRTQRKQIEAAVEVLGGVIPPHCWQYSGQEKATPDRDQERVKLDKLLDDAGRGLFDAVIVCDASRWSRDNAKSKKGLEILKDNNIKFFIGVTEYDLNQPEHRLFLGLSAEIGEFHAAQQTWKSVLNRIERAKRDIPTGGKLPYGRLFKNGQWSLDEDKKKGIEWAAGEYLKGRNLSIIALKLGVSAANLWKVLTRRSGDTWQIEFNKKKKSKVLKITQSVEFKIPPLLSQETINKILKQAQANKTYHHGQLKMNRYLLSHMIFCAKCGYAMTGMTKNGQQYYRHPQRERMRPCNNPGFQRIPALELEDAVIAHLFGMFGDKKAIEQGIAAAIPKASEVPQIEASLVDLNKELAKVRAKIERVVTSIGEGTITKDQATKTMSKFEESETALTEEIIILQQKLNSIPARKEIQDRARQLMIRAGKLRAQEQHFKDAEHFDRMSYENKRALAEAAFAGRDAEGHRLGIYVSKGGGDDVKWTFTIKGILPEEYFGEAVGYLPMSEEWKDMLIGKFDPEYDLMPEDFIEQNQNTKYASSSACTSP